jgi:hypothetical protein
MRTLRPTVQPQFAEPLQESRVAGLKFRIVRHARHEHADAPHALALLRARRERPRDRCAAERCYQFPPSNNDWHLTLRARAA